MKPKKRPYVIHFLAIKTLSHLSIKTSLGLKHETSSDSVEVAKGPLSQIGLLKKYKFMLKIVGRNSLKQEIYQRSFESDGIGNFMLKIPLQESFNDLAILQLYEVAQFPGLEISLGSYFPIELINNKKIIICDFDKTLVETRYATSMDVFHSLTRPVDFFPSIPNSLTLLKDYIEKGYHPFILSASPHFYEKTIRDWLYQNKIYTAGIFLKDYRNIFSISEGILAPKDIKLQGLYKLNHLLDILLMVGMPQSLVLIGDHFESDLLIYLILEKMLNSDLSPAQLWNKVKGLDSFKLTTKQDGQFLNKIYQIKGLTKKQDNQETPQLQTKIYIRKRSNETANDRLPNFLSHSINKVEFYNADAAGRISS